MAEFTIEKTFTIEGIEIVRLAYRAVHHRKFLQHSFATHQRDATTEIEIVRTDKSHDEFLVMRNRAATVLILTLTTSCSAATRHDQRSVATRSTLAPAATSTSRAATSATSTTTTLWTASTLALGDPIVTPVLQDSDFGDAATRIVQQLIDGESPSLVPDAELWSGVALGGRVIQTTVLDSSANRAVVAVSIAFDTLPDKAITEPIAFRVELLRQGVDWVVTAIGYL